MKKIGLIAVAAILFVLLAGRWYYVSQIEKHLDQAASVVSQAGGRLTYRDVGISLGGVIAIEEFRASIPGAGAELRVDRIALDTGSPLGVHRLANMTRSRTLPERLSLSLEGLVMPVTKDNTAAMHPLGVPGMGRFLSAGCDNRENFTPIDYVNMDYADPIFNTRLEYQVEGGGELVTISLVSESDNLHQSDVSAKFSLGAKSLAFADIARAAPDSRLLEAVLDYQDLGFYNRVLSFCESETELLPQQYRKRHLQAWQEAWKWLQLKPGLGTRNAYEKFLASPRQVSLTIEPVQTMSVMGLYNTLPEQVPYRFHTAVAVNGTPLGHLDVAMLTPEESSAWFEQQRLAREAERRLKSEPLAPEQELEPVPRNQWADHIDEDMVLVQVDGASVKGVIERLEERVLQFKVFSHGGFIVRPFEYNRIQALYLAIDYER